MSPNGEDARLARLAFKQYGLFTTEQARTLGLDDSALARRIRKGLVERVFRGVLVFSCAPRSWRQQLLAVCLRAPGKIFVSHRAAAALWELDGFDESLIEVTSICNLRSCRSVIVHSRRHLPSRDTTAIGRIPVTSAHRTLLDLGEVIARENVEIALESFLRRRPGDEERLLKRAQELSTNGRAGPNILREIIEQRGTHPATDSALEVRFLHFLRHHHLPVPSRQVVVARPEGRWARVDFMYEDRKVIIEIDGRSHHQRRSQWEADLRRRNDLSALGYKVMHATHDRIVNDGERLADELRRVLRL